MIGSTRNVKVFIHNEPTDLRKGYNGLFALARDVLHCDPLSGHIFLFVSRNRKRCKALHWDGNGLAIYMKRAEDFLFIAPWERCSGGRPCEMTTAELALFLQGSKAVRTSLSPRPYVIEQSQRD
jgi:transposase|tara:strand:- start:1557 stop:1928 length:372 start_codon:yes stop_codon:yes gene_type:complete